MKRLYPKVSANETLPSLFDFSAPAAAPPAPQPKAAAPAPAPKQKPAAAPEAPHKVFDTLAARVETFVRNNDFRALLAMSGRYDGVRLDEGSRGGTSFKAISRDRLEHILGRWTSGCWTEGTTLRSALRMEHKKDDVHVIHVGILDESGEMHVMPLSLTTDATAMHRGVDTVTFVTILSMTPGKWDSPRKAVQSMLFVQSSDELSQIIREKKPWVVPWLNGKGYSLLSYLAAPWLETLDKAGYRFAENYLQPQEYFDRSYQQLNLLVQPGTKPANIFKTTKEVYTALKNEPNLQIWDLFRRMCKTGKLDQDTMRQVYEAGYTIKDLEYVSSILNARHDGKPVFTWTSLVNYLGRIDMYEAIDRREGLLILSDYLSMCHQLDMKPRTDGDSLKREHDIAARLMRERRNEIEAERMRQNAEKVKTAMPFLEYHEENFFIRPITEYDDLIDEATQQHNCVACYAGRIASGQTIILTMRETRTPNRSLITVELSPDCKTIRQKFLAGNQRIHNKAMTEFLERWHRQVKQALAKQMSQKETQTLVAT